MATRELPDPELLRKLLRYEPETGKLFWLPRPLEMFPDHRSGKIWNTRYAGMETFNRIDNRGYSVATLMGAPISGHRIAWAVFYGRWATKTIDHINGDRTDNRITNLREVTHRENLLNAKKRSDNTSEVTGVHWRKSDQKWGAQIHINGRGKTLGAFATFDKAVEARLLAEKDAGFHKNHGRAIKF
jgi:hypothetical protein